MADVGHIETDAIINETERELRRIYLRAQTETQAKLDNYLKAFAEKDEIKRDQLARGEITQKEYSYWRTGQICIGKRWQEMVDTLAEDYTNADKIAMSVVNGHTPDAYALNHNYGTFQVEQGSLVDTSYTLYDRQTVERLVRDDPDLLPKARIDIPKDKRWNKQHIINEITQSILQGEDLHKVAKRLQNVTDMDKRAASRNARTIITGAQNAGRVDSYKRAEKMGISLKQEWVATLDGRTRHSHRQLDGEKVNIGEEFSNGCKFPGDPDGSPSEVYNCRCTLIADVEGVDTSDAERYDANLDGMSYEEWKNYHKEKNGIKDQDESSILSEKERNTYTERRKERLAARRQKAVDFDTSPIFDVLKYAETELKTDIDFRGATEQAKRGLVKAVDRFEKAGGTIGNAKVVFGGTLGNYGYYDPKTNTIHLRTNNNFVEKMLEENARSMFKLGRLRWVDPTYEGMAAHELGHAFDRYFGQEISREISRKGLLKEAFSISSYAATEPAIGSPRASEAVAENIAAYLAGDAKKEKIDPQIIEILKKYFGGRK